MAAGVLIGAEAKDLRGAAVGTVEDLILDVRDGRVLYVIVDGRQRYFTLPIRALRTREGGVASSTSSFPRRKTKRRTFRQACSRTAASRRSALAGRAPSS